MIPVTLKPEPNNFDVEVRRIGLLFLQCCPNPHGRDWQGKDYWRKITPVFYDSYQGLCAYTGMWFARSNRIGEHCSIDHFRPKSIYPHLAYEWNNYRLTTQRINGYKDNDDNIVDPFLVQNGWIVLDFPSCLVKAGHNISDPKMNQQIEHTINHLKLNDDNDLVDSRADIVKLYLQGCITFCDMEQKYPFIAYELKRQNLTDIAELNKIFRTP
ncbi:MAG: hypothetical protein LBG58_11990 [Planctomycetaceae bacterium]|jgi:hypothetical protein|nr:hypothetical protein [Planctomycetaceae bacterium]